MISVKLLRKRWFRESCKGCESNKLIKNGKTSYGTQRYKCKECCNTYSEGDRRLKHGLQKRLKVIKMYLEGIGISSIERLEGVSNPLIIYWIRHFCATDPKRDEKETYTR